MGHKIWLLSYARILNRLAPILVVSTNFDLKIIIVVQQFITSFRKKVLFQANGNFSL